MRKPKEWSYERIEKSKLLTRRFVKAFKEEMAAMGETFDVEPTNEYILNIFKTKGYWSGLKYNISFSFEFGFEYEQRRYGSQDPYLCIV